MSVGFLRFSFRSVRLAQIMRLTRPGGCTMVTFWSWMVDVRTSISIVRTPSHRGNG